MSQQVATAPFSSPPLQAAAPGQVQPAGSSAPPAPQHSTPRRLRRLSLGLIAACVAFGILASLTFVLLASALGRASGSTAQLIRVQQIQTNLLAADATATNAYLVGGLEPPAQRRAYDAAITAATTGIAEAATAEPADEAVLAKLNEQLVSYVALIEDARANNRQGFPIGAQYQRLASAGLRADALPLLDNLVTANAERAQSQMLLWQIAVLAVAGGGALALLIVAQRWLAQRFRRRLNPLVVTATAVVGLTWVVGLIAIGATGAAVRSIQQGAFADVNAVASARIQGFNAKSNESLTLIARGSGASFDKAWQASAVIVNDNLAGLPADLRSSWRAYTTVHNEIRKLDDAGQWDQAVARATGTGADSSNATFNSYDRTTADYLGQVTAQTESGLAGSRVGLIIGAVLSLLAGLAAAVIGRRGVELRLKEYR